MRKKIKKFLSRKITVMFVFSLYLLILFYFLFLSGYLGRDEAFCSYRYNLTPFKEISRYISRPKTIGFLRVFINLAGNVLAFIPLGLFLPVFTNKKKKGLFTFLSGLLLILMIEFLQFFSRVGCYDVDDIILNMTGILIGYLCYVFFAVEKSGKI